MVTRTLITGGAGFIGSHLARHCLGRGDEVHIVARPTSSLGRLDGFRSALTVHRADLRDPVGLRDILAAAAPDRIYHLACDSACNHATDIADAIATEQDLRALLGLFQAVATMSHRPKILIRAGSIAEYGTGAGALREDQARHPLTTYGAGLLAGTLYARILQRQIGVPIVTARLALAYGATQSERFLVPMLVNRCLEGKAVTVQRPGDRRDLIHVSDVVEALDRLGERAPRGCDVINIGTGIAPSVAEVAAIIVRATGADPALVTFGTPTGRPNRLCISTARARALLGWSAHIAFAEGVVELVASLRAARSLAA